ncbi:site-specific DNA-methyltransferase [Moraxella osloensis]|uniref:site-specific DNA-methyltransferase (adenine-specific) n=1 Tax=Faucicola osloensis TaxID=34062 RepID=A0AA86HQ23_FAUOS|nr:site-specific DNA-methyltransferase [Moraxella osloensis]ATW72022.1 site-specific DNA-methyltransferase [Moraxella osloensis]
MTTLKMHTPNLVDSNIDRLAALFPNCVTEKPKTDANGNLIKDANGQAILERGIDFELLKQELSHSVIDGSQERYRLDWVGKREAIVTANSPIAKTLRPCRDESVDFDTTGNLFIEGDNLEALKLLQESYLGKVKMIYIDPPYNTGNDFIYNDDFAEDTQAFFERSGQVDADGNRLVANTESNGRFHSDWLSMMYSRLKLARNLLADDGVIFISIDDNEQANLKKICDEIFGLDNFRNIIAVKRGAKSVQSQFENIDKLGISYEHVLVYTKNVSFRLPKFYFDLDEKRSGSWNNHWRGTDRPTMRYEIFGINIEQGQWRWAKERSELAIENYKKLTNELGEEPSQEEIDDWYFRNNQPDLLRLSKTKKPEHFIPPTSTKFGHNLWTDLMVGKSSVLTNLDLNYFDNPKNPELIQRMIKWICRRNDLILDFFAGSSTTAHAVMQLNAEDGGNRQFIMVQIPENTDPKSEAFKAGYPTIAEISKERIRRAGAKIKTDNADKDLSHLDTGFRVLKIDTSNMNDIYYRPQDYSQDLLHQLENNIKEDRSDEDLLFQFMLDTGVPLSLPIERTELSSKSGGHTIYQVGGNSLIASLDYIDANMVNDIAALNPLKFITSERAIATDSDKTNIKERFKQLSPHTDVRFI